MTDKTLEERVNELESIAHTHAIPMEEKNKLSDEDAEKAKSKGKAHGDPIFIID